MMRMRLRTLLIPALAASFLGAYALRRRSEYKVGGTPIQVSDDVFGSYRAGDFVIVLKDQQDGNARGASLEITHHSRPERILWQSAPGESFVAAARGCERVSGARAHYSIRDRLQEAYPRQTIDRLEKIGSALIIEGRLCSERASGEVGYKLTFSPETSRRLRFVVEVDEPCNRVYLTCASEADERFFGFGTQYTYFDLKGKRLPIFIGERGVGRGTQPATLLANLRYGAGGSWHSSYACVPHYMTSKLRSMFLENYEYSVFDMREDTRVRVELFSRRMAGQILSGDSPAELIEVYTEFCGRMCPLPGWILDGAVVGLQGGTQRLLEIKEKLDALGVPVAAFWLQDWVGQRTTSFGDQLWWYWELDKERYPDWDALEERLEQEGIRLMTYINPFLVDVSAKQNHHRNLFEEARSKGYLVTNQSGVPYMVKITDFSAALLDLTNRRAREWIKSIIKENLIGSGISGWMADFGEGLPYDAVLSSGESPASYHNRYAEDWARVNREAIQEAGFGEEALFFSRSGYTRSPGQSILFWLGDQLVRWDRYDGIKTAITGMLSSGISGYSLTHSDTGGYTTITSPIRNYHRSKELLLRWIELSAFTTVLRTHEGNRPGVNHQVYSDAETLRHFARFARIYRALKSYRKELIGEAYRTGMPVIRHPFLHYWRDLEVQKLEYQFMVGAEFMVAPVLDPGRKTVKVYLPAGGWVHLWSGERHNSPEGAWLTVDAPIGRPAVFFREGSDAGLRFREELEKLGILE